MKGVILSFLVWSSGGTNSEKNERKTTECRSPWVQIPVPPLTFWGSRASWLIFLWLHFLVHKMRILLLATAQDCCEDGWVTICKARRRVPRSQWVPWKWWLLECLSFSVEEIIMQVSLTYTTHQHTHNTHITHTNAQLSTHTTATTHTEQNMQDIQHTYVTRTSIVSCSVLGGFSQL